MEIYISINLIGEDRDTTVIYCNFSETIVDIHADSVMVSGFTIKSCEVMERQPYTIAVKIKNCENVVIKNNNILTYKDTAVSLEDSSNNRIQDNVISENGRVGIGIGQDSFFNNISGNEIYGYEHAIELGGVYNTIYGNYIHDNLGGIKGEGIRNRIINNIITNNTHEGGIMGNQVDDILISKNIITNNGGISGGSISYFPEVEWAINNISIIDNYISGNKKFGIFLWSHVNTVISGNIITNNEKGGLYLSGSPNCHVTNNQISNNNGIGLEFKGYSYDVDNLISNNHISNNSGSGLSFTGGKVQITDNHISDNKEYGIYFPHGLASVIAGNNIVDNSINAFFVIEVLFIAILINILVQYPFYRNTWYANYYSDYNGGRFYIIHGRICLLINYYFPWFAFDWRPAKEPYDIEIVDRI